MPSFGSRDTGISLFTMFVSLSFWCLLVSFPVLGAARPVVVPRSQEVLAGGGAGTGAGYSPRLGPDNANCTRQVYNLPNITSTNIIFEGVDSNANQVRKRSPHLATGIVLLR